MNWYALILIGFVVFTAFVAGMIIGFILGASFEGANYDYDFPD